MTTPMSPSRPPEASTSGEYAASLQWEPLGRHRYSLIDDLLILCTEGVIEEEDMARLLPLLAQQVKKFGAALLLIDASHGLSLSADARRRYAEYGRQNGFQPGSTAVLGASTTARTIITLITNGIGMFLRQVPPVRFCKRRSEAMTWLHSERARWRSVLAASSS